MLLVATALNLATYAPPWQAALPGISYRNAFVLSMSSSASTYLAPGGPAVGVALSYGMLRSWGFRKKDVTLAVALTGTWNQFIMLGLPSLALALLTIVGEHHSLLKTVALIGLGVFVIAAVVLCRRALEPPPRPLGREPEREDRLLGAADLPPRPRLVDGRDLRRVPRRGGRDCSAAAGTCSRRRRSRAS